MILDINKLCLELNKTLHQLAREINYDYPNLYKMANRNRNVTLSLINKLIENYDLEPNDIWKYKI